jgi:hypothetical protein
MKTLITIVVFSFFALSSCYYDNQEFLYPQISTSCDTTNYTFSGGVAPILQNSCLSCHSNSSAASYGGGIKLEDYTDVKARALDGKLLGTIKHSSGYTPMPYPSGTSQLENCKITIIQKWVDAGEPNNK